MLSNFGIAVFLAASTYLAIAAWMFEQKGASASTRVWIWSARVALPLLSILGIAEVYRMIGAQVWVVIVALCFFGYLLAMNHRR